MEQGRNREDVYYTGLTSCLMDTCNSNCISPITCGYAMGSPLVVASR